MAYSRRIADLNRPEGAPLAPATGAVVRPAVLLDPTTGVTLTADATATLAITESAAGVLPIAGAGAATLPLTGSATGALTILGAGAATLSLSESGAGSLDIVGAASTTLAPTFSATGGLPIVADAAMTLTPIATASGALLIVGAATVPLALASTGDASLPIVGAATATVPITATADGIVMDPLPAIVGDAATAFAITSAAAGTNGDESVPDVSFEVIPMRRSSRIGHGSAVLTLASRGTGTVDPVSDDDLFTLLMAA